MPTITNSNIPTPKSWDEFESIVLSTSKLRWKTTEFFGNGRRGQRQDGVDVFGISAEGFSIGVQCKNTISGLTEATIQKEIKNASSFEPALKSLYVATTASRDSMIQEKIRQISKARVAAGEFSVHLLFWEDISGDLALDDREFFKHYPQFLPKANLPKEHDKKLYDQLMELLPTAGIIEFLDHHNMAGFSFIDAKLDPLRKFYYEWNRVDHEFIKNELEDIRKQLWAKSDEYLEIIATQTFSSGRSAEYRSVPEEWELEQPERFDMVVNSLHSLAGEIVELHGTLIRSAREYFIGKI